MSLREEDMILLSFLWFLGSFYELTGRRYDLIEFLMISREFFMSLREEDMVSREFWGFLCLLLFVATLQIKGLELKL